MKIDFHCHTKATKSNENIKRNVTNELFKSKTENVGVECIAITNHNAFDLTQYNALKESVKEATMVWPGIELDVKGDISNGHIIVIGNPDNIDEFNMFVDQLEIENVDTYEISISRLSSYINDIDVFMIGHFVKHKSLDIKDLEKLKSLLTKKTRLLMEPGSLTSIGVLHSYNHRVLIGSDVQDWDKYEECNFGDLKFLIDTYSNFLKLIDKNINLINDLIKENYVEDVNVYGDTKNKNFKFMMPIYNDVNIIFGDKGSGKSEILKSLNQYYTVEKSLEPVFYEGGSKDEWFSKKLKKISTDFDCSLYEITDKKYEELMYIKNYKDANPKSLSTYINYFNELSTNKKRKNMAILNIKKTHSFDIVNYSILKNEYNKIKKFCDDVQKFKINKSNPKYDVFNNYLKEYKKASFDILRSEFINQYSTKLFDDCIERMNSYVSDGTGTPPQPTETGFATFAKNRIGLMKKIATIKAALSTSIESEKEYIGDVGNKGKGYLLTDVKLVNSLNVDDLDYSKMKSNKTDIKTFLNLLGKIERNVLKGNVMNEITEISFLMDQKELTDLDAFLFVSKEFLLGNSKYNPSKGEKAILALQYELLSEDSSDIYLIDEPELSLGSMYIEENIVPLIRDLSNRKKIVVVATHDANIAIRTRPVNAILKTVDNNSYLTYKGSMFTSELRNINNIEDIRSWRTESIKHLEGGEEAFEERGYLYEKS